MKRYTIEIERVTNNNGIIRERHSVNEYIYGPWCKYDDAINENHAELKRRDDEIAELKLRMAVAINAPMINTKDILMMSVDQIEQLLKIHPEFVPTGTKP